MELWFALKLLLILVLALVAMRYAANTRRRREARERERRRRLRQKQEGAPRMMSKRAEMRAYEDPSTLAGDITTTHGSIPSADHPGGDISAPPRPAQRATARQKPGPGTDKRRR
jgi:hypothetical protein